MADKKEEIQEKQTKEFGRIIKAYLDKFAAEDEAFMKKYRNPKKNLGECMCYIINQVKISGLNGFADSEIFGMAVHYYDEEDIKPGSPIKCQIVTNHFHELTEEEINEAKEKAIRDIIEDEKKRLRDNAEKKKKKQEAFKNPLIKVEKKEDGTVEVKKIDQPKEKPKFEQQTLF